MKNTITFTVLWGLLGFALLLWGCSEEYEIVLSKTPQLIFDEIVAECPVWSPSGNTIVFSGDDGMGVKGLWTIDPEGGSLKLLLSRNYFDPPAYHLYPHCYSDDGYLLFTDDNSLLPGNIYYLPPQGNEPVFIFQATRPTVKGNLDGTYNIAYIVHECPGKKNGIYLTDIHGSEPQLVVEEKYINGLDWSPDGTMLTYVRRIHLSEFEWDYKLCVYDLSSQNEEVIYETSNIGINCNCWSPDGELIAFVTSYEGTDKGEVYIIPAEGGEPRRITNFPYDPNMEMGGAGSPSWSPDGKWIVYSLMARELWKVYVD